MTILDGAVLNAALHGVVSDPRTYLLRFYPDAPAPSLEQIAEDVKPLDAEVNHGTWIWLCPCKLGGLDDPPRGGGVAFIETPLGWCVRCENVDIGGVWRRLRFPPERVEIERLLLLRPDPTEQNWWPLESVDDLKAQNRANGIEVA